MTIQSAAVEAEPISRAEYLHTLRPLLPAEAFRPYPRAYVPILIHVAVVIAGWIAIGAIRDPIWWVLWSLIIGNSLSALAFLAHDVAHRTVTTNRYLQYPTELFLWALMYVPATVWRYVHGSHHAHTNSDEDTDRRFLSSELNVTGTIAAATLYPNRHLRYSFIFLLFWFVFPFRHTIVALLYPGRKKPSYVTAKPRYVSRDKLWIVFELVFIAALQGGVAAITHDGFFWASIFPTIVTSAVVSWYFFTNHGLKPVDDGNDILAATTTVRVPGWCNTLHSNFAYHAEHHLFPNMNPHFYPMVGDLLRRHFPTKYHCIPIWEAWRGLLQNALATPRRGEAPAQGDRAAGRVEIGDRPGRTATSP